MTRSADERFPNRAGASLLLLSVLLLSQHPSIDAAIAKNGSIAAYVASASQLGTYVATLVALVVAAVRHNATVDLEAMAQSP